jgi:hypothetical protein
LLFHWWISFKNHDTRVIILSNLPPFTCNVAGLATAFAGSELGLEVTVVLPESTPKFVADELEK